MPTSQAAGNPESFQAFLAELRTQATQPANPTKSPFYSIAELAKMLSVDRRTVERWFSSGRIPKAARVELSARAVRLKRDVIDQWIQDGCPAESE